MNFTYSPLLDATNQIRLLRPTSENRGDSLAFTLGVYSLINPSTDSEANTQNDAPPYIAMSYTWGSPKKSFAVIINGKQLKVGANCHYALSQACQHQLPGMNESYFWIDQICINQSDRIEKGQQVSIMGNIYQGAYAVYASIGHQTEESQFLCQVINSIDGQTFKESETSVRFDLIRSAVSEANVRYPKSAGLDACLDTFARHKYFSRLWITQELWLSKNTIILCGQESMSFNILGLVWVSTFEDDSTMPEYGGGSVYVDSVYPFVPLVVKYLFYYGASKRELSLIKAIEITEQLHCFNPLDIIYAIQSMVTWPQDLGPIQPDYTITTLELFWRAVPYLKGVKLDYDSDDDCEFFCRALSMSLEDAGLAASRLDYIKRLRKNLSLREELETLAIIKELYPLHDPDLLDKYAHLLQQKDRGWYGQD